MLRLSVTTVEAFRLWRDTGDWMELEALEATIRKDSPPNERMLRGTAFHAVLERPVRQEALGEWWYEANGYRFAGEGTDRALRLLPEGRICEAKAEKVIDGITLVGRADALHGIDGYEAKLTDKIDVERYFDSFQWRAYCVLFGVKCVRYILAEGPATGTFVNVYNVLPLPLYRYPALETDVRRMMMDCANFIEQRNLASYVQEAA